MKVSRKSGTAVTVAWTAVKGGHGIYSDQDHGSGRHTDFGNGKGNLICRYTCDKWTGIYI